MGCLVLDVVVSVHHLQEMFCSLSGHKYTVLHVYCVGGHLCNTWLLPKHVGKCGFVACRRFEFSFATTPASVGMATGATIHTANGLRVKVARRQGVPSGAVSSKADLAAV